MRSALVCGLLLTACGPSPVGGGRDPRPTDSGPPGSSGSGLLEVRCEPTDNVLRYLCTASVDPPGPVHLTVAKTAGGSARTWTSEAVSAEHTLPVYLLAPRTDYTFTASGPDGAQAQGTFTTGVLPESAQVLFDVEGDATFPWFATISPCVQGATVLLASTEGEVVWYEELGDRTTPFAFVDSMSFTEDGTVLAIVSGDVVEVDLLGNELLRLEYGADFDETVHHDVFRKDGHTWVLYKDPVTFEGEDYALDGFYVFDAEGTRVAEWRLFDHFRPTVPNGRLGTDYSHANSIWVDDAGDVYLSMRHLSAVAVVDGNLGSPGFGSIRWRLSGDPTNQAFGSDLVLTAADAGVSPTFLQQHNAHLLPDGTLAMFDNRVGSEPSRVLHLDVDEAAGEASIVEAYELGVHCDFQGSAWHTPEGNPVATCAPLRTAVEFDRLTTEPRWSARMDCYSGIHAYVPRFVPLEDSDL